MLRAFRRRLFNVRVVVFPTPGGHAVAVTPHIVDYLQPVEGAQLCTMRYTESEARRRVHTDSMACPLTVVRITPSPRSSDPDNDANSSLARMLVTLSTSSVLQPQACEMMAPRLRA